MANPTLGVSLVLLSLALALDVVTARHGANDFLCLALYTLDDALDALLGTTLFRHEILLLLICLHGDLAR